MLGSINAMFLMCFRLSKLHEAGKMSHADASMVKAWTTLRGMFLSVYGPAVLTISVKSETLASVVLQLSHCHACLRFDLTWLFLHAF